MVSNVNPTDPKFIDGDDLDTEGHGRHDNLDGVSPTEQDTAGFRAMADQAEGWRAVTGDDDTEGHRIIAAAEGQQPTEDDDTEGHLKSL